MASLLTKRDFIGLTFDFEAALDQQAEIQRKQLLQQQTEANRPLCKYFVKGACAKGDTCPFRHARVDKEKTVVCKHWLRGLCKKGVECEFLHAYDLAKMPICVHWQQYGNCPNVDCPYKHEKPEDRPECDQYNRGFCRHGPDCRYRHVFREACPRYLAGFCPAGPYCTRGHPKFETSAQNSVVCFRCGVKGHTQSVCPQTTFSHTSTNPTNPGNPTNPTRPLEQVTCFKCGAKGHYANACPKSLMNVTIV